MLPNLSDEAVVGIIIGVPFIGLYIWSLWNSSKAKAFNEGWGLSLTEALLVGNPIIANVTGGMQDQMRFSKKGKWIDFDEKFPSNHNGTIKEHGEWAFPVYPTNRSIQGYLTLQGSLNQGTGVTNGNRRIRIYYRLFNWSSFIFLG